MSAIEAAPEAIRKLMSLAEPGMREDAAEVPAKAREALMRLFRQAHLRGQAGFRKLEVARLSEWTELDFEALHWVARLAATGHASARNLVDWVLCLHAGIGYDQFATECLPATQGIARIAQMADVYPPIARFLAAAECAQPQPRYDKAREWLVACGDAWLESFDGKVERLAAAGEVDARRLREHRAVIFSACWSRAWT